MYAQIIVPLDGGTFSARALEPALHVAAACDAPLLLLSYAATAAHLTDQRHAIDRLLADLDRVDVTAKVDKVDDIGRAVAGEVAEQPGSLVCMSSVGRAHTGHVLGSVAESILREVSTPLVLVGPSADVKAFALDRPLTVCVDGSKTSETILPIAASWSIVFGLELRVLSVQSELARVPAIVDPASESAYVRRIARRLERDVTHAVDYDVLHGHDAISSIVDDASEHHASLVAAATHGEGGLRRMVAGSVTMGLVHRAPCPVLAYRPLHYLR